MTTLILVPTPKEFDGLGLNTKPMADSSSFLKFSWKNCQIAISGVGPASGVVCANLLASGNFSKVVLLGIAGAVQISDYELGQVVQARSEVALDLGFQNANYQNLDKMNLDLLVTSNANYGCEFDCATIGVDLPTAKFATVNAMSQSDAQIKSLQNDYQAHVENMEGAWVALACRLASIPFSEVRAISNWLGPRNPKSWRIGPALSNLSSWLEGQKF